MAEPAGILAEIACAKRIEVSSRLGTVTVGELRSRARPTRRSLAETLSRPGARFIMEVKKASPSAGSIRDVAAADQARAYEGAASAISVLTDERFFGGSLADLRLVRQAYGGPILAKDFIVDPRQVAEARLNGADAVLVLLSLLDDTEANAVIAEARTLGMDALVEAHEEGEVRRAVALGARLIGINNRDLRSFAVDLAVTERLAPLVPADRLVVSESGIGSRADVERLAAHADAFLVGTALMRAERPEQAARTLAFGPVKVCGITSAADLDDAAGAGARWAGFVMVPGTPRAVTAAAVEAILAEASGRIRRVGIFRNEHPRHVKAVAQSLGLDAVQLHGEEEPHAYRALLSGEVEVWAAVQVGAGHDPRAGADRLLFDSGAGGTGRTFDWSRVKGRRELRSGLLAGGLRPGNARAAARVGAWALDVGSGVEAQPGRKDPFKLAAFFEALRLPARGEAG